MKIWERIPIKESEKWKILTKDKVKGKRESGWLRRQGRNQRNKKKERKRKIITIKKERLF